MEPRKKVKTEKADKEAQEEVDVDVAGLEDNEEDEE